MPTGVEGLDEIVGGGFPRGSNIVISGVPGSGKTLLSAQFLYKGITEQGEPGVFVTLMQRPQSILRNMKKFGMDFEYLISRKKIVLVDANPARGELSLTEAGRHAGLPEFTAQGLSEVIRGKVYEIGAKRVVIDPLTALLIHYKEDFETELEVVRLLYELEKLGCTVLLTSEPRLQAKDHFPLEHFISDGVIMMELLQTGAGIVRGLQIMKLREVEHDCDFHLYKITQGGIVVYPKERIMR